MSECGSVARTWQFLPNRVSFTNFLPQSSLWVGCHFSSSVLQPEALLTSPAASLLWFCKCQMCIAVWRHSWSKSFFSFLICERWKALTPNKLLVVHPTPAWHLLPRGPSWSTWGVLKNTNAPRNFIKLVWGAAWVNPISSSSQGPLK